MDIIVPISATSVFSLYSGFQSRFCHTHWFYPQWSVKRSKW